MRSPVRARGALSVVTASCTTASTAAPPEFFTRVHSNTDGLRWGLPRDEPALGFRGTASFYDNDSDAIQVYRGLFDALALAAVEGLLRGEQGVRETAKVRPARQETVAAVLEHLSPQLRAMIQLQNLTGMRSTVCCILRTCDVDRSVDPWVYRPGHHKTEHLDHERLVHIGPHGQAVLTRFLRLHEPVTVYRPLRFYPARGPVASARFAISS